MTKSRKKNLRFFTGQVSKSNFTVIARAVARSNPMRLPRRFTPRNDEKEGCFKI